MGDSAMRNAAFQEVARELLIDLDINRLIMDISTNCFQFFGYTKQEVTDTCINNYITENLDIEYGKTTSRELTLKNKFGVRIHCDSLIISDKKGNAKLSLINISKYKELELWEGRFRRMIENTKDMVYLYDILPEKNLFI